MMIQSTGYLLDATIIWELEADEFDFSCSEFDELISLIKTESLFDFLKKNRPALLNRLMLIKQELYLEEELEDKDWEHLLETALRNLNLRLRR